MTVILHNPPGVFPPYRCYAHATEVSAGSRTLYISGLNGFHVDGKTMPESFEEQAELIWQHLGAILKSAGMGVGNLVSLRIIWQTPRRRGERADEGQTPGLPPSRVDRGVLAAA